MDINRLKQYRAIQREIKKIEGDIARLRDKPNKYKFGVDTVMSSSPTLPYTKRPITIAGYGYDSTNDGKKHDLIKKLIIRKTELEKEFYAIHDFIETIDDSEVRQIVGYKYIDGLTWRKIGRLMNYSKSGVHDKYMRFIESSDKTDK